MSTKSNLVVSGLALLLWALVVWLASPQALAQGDRSATAGDENADGIAISLRELKADMTSKDARQLFAATRLHGFLFAEDRLGKDCILVCVQESGRPALRLHDLAVAYSNVLAGDARPACTIDPRADVLRRLHEVGQRIMSSAHAPSDVERQLQEYQKLAESPQDVKVFNVDPDTRFANTMVDADYHVKSICNGTETVRGITGITDIVLREARAELSRTGTMRPIQLYNRFWFNPGDVAYRTDGRLFLLTSCEVVLLTEQEAVSQAGKRAGMSKVNPFAKEFAERFTDSFSDVCQSKPIYRELENLYRAVAVADLMLAEASRFGALGVLADSLGKAEIGRERLTRTRPGKYAVKKLEERVRRGVVSLWLPSCGGVSMDIRMDQAKKESDFTGELRILAGQIVARRPQSDAITWRFPFSIRGRAPSVADRSDSRAGGGLRPSMPVQDVAVRDLLEASIEGLPQNLTVRLPGIEPVQLTGIENLLSEGPVDRVTLRELESRLKTVLSQIGPKDLLVVCPQLPPRQLIKLQAALQRIDPVRGRRIVTTRSETVGRARRNMQLAGAIPISKDGQTNVTFVVEQETFTETQLRVVGRMKAPPAFSNEHWITTSDRSPQDDGVVILFGENAERLKESIERRGERKDFEGKLVVLLTCQDQGEHGHAGLADVLVGYGAVGVLGFDMVLNIQAVPLIVNELDRILDEANRSTDDNLEVNGLDPAEAFLEAVRRCLERAEDSSDPDHWLYFRSKRTFETLLYRGFRRADVPRSLDRYRLLAVHLWRGNMPEELRVGPLPLGQMTVCS
jgi:hypothetical protein